MAIQSSGKLRPGTIGLKPWLKMHGPRRTKISLALETTNPQILAGLAVCSDKKVRSTVAENSHTPWKSVAIILSKIPKETYRICVGTTESWEQGEMIGFMNPDAQYENILVKNPKCDVRSDYNYFLHDSRLPKEWHDMGIGEVILDNPFSLKKSELKNILLVHDTHKAEIMEELKTLNPNLHAILVILA